MVKPKLSVVMAVHNGLPYMEEAVDSILRQTFVDYEFIVVDDASTDGSAEALAACRDGRLRLITNERNLGLTKSLNRALELSQGEYLARMDHDDLSLPLRLSAQVEFLDANSEIDVLGTWAQTLGAQPEQIWRYPLNDDEIRCELLFHSVLVHSSVVWRRSTFERHNLRYDPDIARAQDYDLWARAAPYVRFANLGRVLHRYRIHSQQVGAQHSAEQQSVADEVRRRQLVALGLEPSQRELDLHNDISTWRFPPRSERLREVEAWLLRLWSANQTSLLYAPNALDKVLERIWWAACSASVKLGPPAWRLYRRSPLAARARRSITQTGGLLAKSLLAQLRSKRE